MSEKPKFIMHLPEGDEREVKVWWANEDAVGDWHLSISVKDPNELKPMNDVRCIFEVGDSVKKVGGDYQFEGHVVAVFTKRSRAIRLVVEDDRGVLHVYSEKNLERKWPFSIA